MRFEFLVKSSLHREGLLNFLLALPIMPETVTGVGAVAMPDGRVLICGGVVVEVKKGGVVSITI